MLNPSTADHLGNNDPTIERCERRSRAWGFARMEVANLFGLRATSPRLLRAAADPVGPENDRFVDALCVRVDMILCAWGADGALLERSGTVLARIGGRPLHCLGLTKAGEPKHPLYLPYTSRPALWPRPGGGGSPD